MELIFVYVALSVVSIAFIIYNWKALRREQRQRI